LTDRIWQTTLIVPARQLDGRAAQIVVGFVTMQKSTWVGLRVDRQDPVMLGIESAGELISSIRQTVVAARK
jgi:hypothetical protein